jgi:probable rRNA maturation factor
MMSRELCLRNRQDTRAVDLPFLRRIARHLLAHHFGIDQFALAIHLIANPEMVRLNEQFLGHAGATDVITFDLGSDGGKLSCLSPVTLETKGPRPNAHLFWGRRAKNGGEKRENASFLYGEIFISVDQTLGQARQFRTTWQEELVRYVIHGLLHMHGYDDLTLLARRKMKRVETRLLREISLAFNLRRLKKSLSNSRP